MNELFKHRDPIGTGAYPLPQKNQTSSTILRTIKNSRYQGKTASVFYIHIPFCSRFCSYCGIKKFHYSKDLLDIYIEALSKEILAYYTHFPDREISSVYFGGGTATLLSNENWRYILKSLFNFKKTNNYEITIEGTPEGFEKEKLSLFREHGVNRISIGVQSMVGKVNQDMTRFYNLDKLEEVVQNALSVIGNVNIDLIYNLPGQSKETFEKDLRLISGMGVTHLTINPFVVIRTAPIYKKIKSNKIDRPNENTEISLFNQALRILKELSFEQYTVRDFNRHGKKCQYILKTAYCYDVIGIGFGSYGFINGTPYRNIHSNLEDYINAVNNDGFSMALYNEPNDEEFMRKIMIQGLRLTNFSIKKAENLHHCSVMPFFDDEIRAITESGLVNICDGEIKHSSEGLIFANNIRAMFGKNIDYLGFGLSSLGESNRGNYE